ncbi:MAG: secondary thiamine-phosphate synthase enzyme YjbQ [Dehalococcoidia bacterium]
MIVSRKFDVLTKGNDDVVDLTPSLRKALLESGIERGTATLFVMGSTAGLTTVEFEPGLVEDLATAFEGVAPRARAYAHNARWHDDNGHSHVRAALLGPSLVVPFFDRVPLLGVWQQVVLIDFDIRPRQREVVCQIVGE